MKLLVVEDEESKRFTMVADLSQAGHMVESASSAAEALDFLERSDVDVVITDLKMPGMDGLELLRSIKDEIAPSTEVIMMTAYGTIPLAVEAIRRGALDFITKPFDNRQIVPMLARIEQKMARKDPATDGGKSSEFLEIEKAVIGRSPPMRHLKHLVRVCAESEANVLLCGETGTGKDLAASVIHRLSERHFYPFVKLNCAVFPENLIENELFGHERGAFTGADQRKTGRLELAQRGTVYLDDVDDIPLKEQVKLLRVIEEKVFEPVGSTTQIKCNARFIASTKTDLNERIQQGAFRQDLYYRLKVIEVNLPPLREHMEDIPLLAGNLVKRFAGKVSVDLTEKVLDRLQEYHWPGNVRELSHTLEQAYILGRGKIRPGDLDLPANSHSLAPPDAGSFKSTIEQTERDLLFRSLEEYGGNKSKAARSLGMKVSTFRDKLRKHELD
ncbi:MAG: sigma-54 dependent transcriptional regulator [Gemmatimonadota bacterium]|nr:sigma-54 dependent transcriptional regulator [Gemmatimonadota bacterium]